MTNSGLKPYGYILTSCVWFSVMALLTHEVNLEGCPWLVVATVRSALATIIAFVLAMILGIPLVFLRPRMLWIRSLAGSCSMLATFYALGNMLVSDVLTITNTFPIWVALLSWPLAREKPSAGVWIAVLCSVSGVMIALQPDQEGFAWKPALSAFGASFFTAVAMLGINRLRGVASLAVVVHFSAVSTLAALAALGIQTLTWPDSLDVQTFERGDVLAMLLAVGVTAAIGQVFLTRAYATGSPTKVSVVALSQVLLVMAVEAWLGRKEITPPVILGTFLVLGPVAWLMARERRPPKAADETELEEVAIE